MSTWKMAGFAVGLSGFLAAQQGGMPGPLTEPQLACIHRWIDIICCVTDSCFPWLATQVPGDHLSCDLARRVRFRPDTIATGGMYTGPDVPGPPPGDPLQGGTFVGANGANPDPDYDPGATNPIGIDPGSFSAPDAAGNVYFDPGTGPNGSDNGTPGPAPGTQMPQALADLVLAGMLYGELGHQDLGCKFGNNGRPLPGQDEKNHWNSEARVYSRAAEFFGWLWRCDGCWADGIPPGDVLSYRRMLLKRADSYKERADYYKQKADNS